MASEILQPIMVAIDFSHPWPECLWMFGIFEKDFGENYSDFFKEFGAHCEDADHMQKAWLWMWSNCRHLRTKLVRGLQMRREIRTSQFTCAEK